MRGVVTAGALVFALAAGPAVEAQQQQQPVFRAGVDLIQVDVVVVGPDGRNVRGLTPQDFVVVDRGVAREIATFVEVTHDAPAGGLSLPGVTIDVASNQSAASERLVILVVDDLHFRDRTDEVKALARRVVAETGGAVSMGMVTTSGRYGVEVTEDRERLLREIDRFEDHYDRGPTVSGIRPPAMVSGAEILGGFFNAPGDMGNAFGSLSAYEVVKDVAHAIGAEDGRRKAIVWISAGVQSAGRRALTQAGQQCAERGGVFSTQLAFFCDSMGGMMDDLRRSSITAYSINPGGDREGGQDLTAIVTETGGFAVPATDLDAGLGRIIADLDNYYLLGFYPDTLEGRDYNALEVRVNRPGVTVRHRRGYSLTGPPDPPENRDPLTDLVASVMPNTDLPLRMSAVPLLTTGSRAQVALTMEVDLQQIPDIAPGAVFEDTLRYGVYVADLDSKKITDTKGRTLTMSWQRADADRPGAHRVLVANVIDLGPGRYQLRLSAISDGLGRSGSVYLHLDVPDFDGDEVAIGGLALAAAGREDVHPKIVDKVTTPNWPLPFQPSLDRWFTPEETLRLFFQVRRKSDRLPASGIAVLMAANGEEVRSQPFELGPDKLTAHDLRLPLVGLESGIYTLEVRATSGEHVAARRVGIIVNDVR